MSTEKVTSNTDCSKKLDNKLIKEIPSTEGIKSVDSLNALRKALKQIEADMDNETTDGDQYGATLTHYEVHLKKCVENEKFLTIFKQLPREEQNAWMSEQYKNVCDLPQSLIELMSGAFYPGDCRRSPTERPDWLDMDKFRKGQQFTKDNYSTVWLGSLYGLYFLYNFEDSLRPIIMSGKSYTPYKAFKRYLSTLKRMDEIYFGEPWTKGSPAYQDVQNIRMQHLAIREKLCKYDNKTLCDASTLEDPYAPKYDVIRKDMQTVCPVPNHGQYPWDLWTASSPKRPKSLNQVEMALVQFGFVVFVILKPDVLGICNATDENLEAYCHMWKGIGYLLGIQDEFNFCRGSLEEIKQRAKDILEYWVKPNLRNYNKNFEHMVRAMFEGLSYFFPLMNYETMALQALELIDLSAPNLYASLSYSTWMFYKIFNFVTRRLIRIPITRKGLNWLLSYSKNRAIDFDAKKHAELQEKSLKSSLNASIYQPLITAQ
ncbi:hypothetical protein KPH14_007104 [Odynerus spinipes]|uniref:ER-bound oxygenase mpaB/mpaB'/Rubber oxygenase catalytic domain-containing protein n=1 Tax=Odynerus spinipes TaxID=1348599 RepID=A0AAD9RSG5_9HYME|nr:hypothetical protein KPH14_007104 [Odynerus spinipes]